jgi:aryl-alcohol dehydrogenase-like predicted oxidoreductase
MTTHFTFKGSSITVNRMGYGAMQLPGPMVWGPPRDEAAALAVLREAVALGVDHIDTAEFYGPHVSNRLIRAALAPYPKTLTIVTKIGAVRGADASWIMAKTADDLARDVDGNLKTLRVDALDIVNLRLGSSHGPDQESVAAPLKALVALQRQGLVRHIGLSTISPKQYEEGIAIADIVCVQNHYNLAHRRDDVLIGDLARDGIAYVPFFPLGGFTPLQSSTLSDVARRLKVTPMVVALAWLLHRSPNILLIPGTSSVAHLHENMAAAQLMLSPQILAELGGIAS